MPKPCGWLQKKIPRTGAALIVFFALLLFLFLPEGRVLPRTTEQLSSVITDIRKFLSDLQKQTASLLGHYPSAQKKILDNSAIEENLPPATRVITNIARISFSHIGGISLNTVQNFIFCSIKISV